MIERLSLIGKSAIICRVAPRDWDPGRRSIHVWWGGLQNNGDMLVLLAHLLSLNPEWRDAEIVINSIATSEMILEHNRRLLERLTAAARIEAHTEVILKPSDSTIQELIWERSAEADVVLLGLRSNAPGEEAAYAERISTMLSRLPSVLMIRNAGEFRGQLLGDISEEETAISE